MLDDSTTAPGGRLFVDRSRAYLAGCIGFLILLAFGPTLVELVEVWLHWPEYGHGLLMPPVAAWLIWERRKLLAEMEPEAGPGAGRLRLLAGLSLLPLVVVLLLGEARYWWGLKPFAFIGALAAGVTIVWGRRGLRVMLAPLVVLLLMCPLPFRLHTALTLPLKRHAAVLATGLLDLSGLRATLDGNLIHVPGIEAMWIADACSGIRSLISLVSISVLGCLVWRRHWGLKALVVASCVPLAVLVNGLRIWMTGMLSAHVSPEVAQGFFHTFEGFLLFGVAAALLLGWALLLDRLLPFPHPAPLTREWARTGARVPWGYGISGFAILMLLVAVVGVYRIRSQVAPEGSTEEAVARMSASYKKLPLEVASGAYRGDPIVWDDEIVKNSGADAYVCVNYSGPEARTYQVYIGGALRNSENFHAPSVCMPAAGWEVIEKNQVPCAWDAYDSKANVKRMVMQRGEDQMLVYYWFQIGSHRAGDEFEVRWQRIKDLIAGRALAPAQICAVYVPIRGGVRLSEEAAQHFLGAIAPFLHEATTSGVIHGQ